MMWLELVFCAGLIIWTASTLSRYADLLSEINDLLAVTPFFLDESLPIMIIRA